MRNAILCHVYYTNKFNELATYINIIKSAGDFDIFFTMPKENKLSIPYIRKHFPDAFFFLTDNIGFDIFPFLNCISRIELDKYDLIFKIHSKKDIPIRYQLNNFDLSGSRWRDELLTSIAGNKNRVNEILRIFSRHPHIGALGSENLIIRGQESVQRDIDCNAVKRYMDECGLIIRNWEFIAGTMFVMRAKLLLPLKNRNFNATDFPPIFPRDWNSLPYCIERMFGCMISAQGYVIGGLPTLLK